MTKAANALRIALNGDADHIDTAVKRGLTTVAAEVDAHRGEVSASIDRLDKRMKSAITLLGTIAATLLGGLITLITALVA